MSYSDGVSSTQLHRGVTFSSSDGSVLEALAGTESVRAFRYTAHRSQTVTPAPLRRCWSPTQDWGPPSARLTPLHDNARNGLITRRARVRIPPPLSRPTRA